MKRDSLLRLKYAKNHYEKNTQLNMDFNILIMLDSCRYDFFKKVYFEYVDGKLKKYYSCGCDTVSWLKNSIDHINNPEKFFFITASPYLDRVKQRKILGEWVFNYYPAYMYFKNKHTNVVHPETLTEIATDKLDEEYLNHKKIVIWYMQPHNPYILENGSFIKDMTPFIKKEMSLTEMWWHYNHNLEYVLRNVKNLIKYIKKQYPNFKIIISSDHGEMFGEHKIYGHPYGVFCRKQQEVPLLEIK